VQRKDFPVPRLWEVEGQLSLSSLKPDHRGILGPRPQGPEDSSPGQVWGRKVPNGHPATPPGPTLFSWIHFIGTHGDPGVFPSSAHPGHLVQGTAWSSQADPRVLLLQMFLDTKGDGGRPHPAGDGPRARLEETRWPPIPNLSNLTPSAQPGALATSRLEGNRPVWGTQRPVSSVALSWLLTGCVASKMLITTWLSFPQGCETGPVRPILHTLED
jgi:hypothetical protein